MTEHLGQHRCHIVIQAERHEGTVSFCIACTRVRPDLRRRQQIVFPTNIEELHGGQLVATHESRTLPPRHENDKPHPTLRLERSRFLRAGPAAPNQWAGTFEARAASSPLAPPRDSTADSPGRAWAMNLQGVARETLRGLELEIKK